MKVDPEHRKLLGATGTTRHTKVTGVVTAICYNVASSPQVSLQQPQKKDGTIPDAYLADIHMTDFTKKMATNKLPTVEETDIELGDKVEDIITGFQGIVTYMTFAANGCCEVFSVTKVDKKHKAVSHYTNCKRLKVVDSEHVVVPDADPVSSTKGSVHFTKAPKRSA